MEKQLGYTSIEQSKKLIEAGLDPKTADMPWEMTAEGLGEPFGWQPYLGKNPVIEMNAFSFRNGYVLPCWSLRALIGLLPKTIETKKPKNLYFSEILPANNYVAYTALNKNKEYVFLKLFATGVESDATLIDNMVSMVCWLLENNYIKREE